MSGFATGPAPVGATWQVLEVKEAAERANLLGLIVKAAERAPRRGSVPTE